MLASSLTEQLAVLQSEVVRLRHLATSNQHGTSGKTFVQLKRDTVDSLINRLPVETISTIFQYAISHPHSPNHFDPWETRRNQLKRFPEDVFFSVTLGGVCRLWRNISLSTPTLWTYFEYPESLWTRKTDCRYLLSLYLYNSKHLPLHLSLTFPSKADNSSLWHPSFDRGLISNLKRIHSLSLQNPSVRWISHLKEVPFIVNLSIDWKDGSRYTKESLPFHKCHTLSRLSLHRAGMPEEGRIIYQVPSSITVLDLSSISIDICIKVMLRCPRLVEAYIREYRGEYDYLTRDRLKRTWFKEPVVFDHLKVFLWDRSGPMEWANVYLEHLSTPILCTVALADSFDGTLRSLSSGETHFIHQLPATVRTLRIEGFSEISVDCLGHLLSPKSSVEHLVISRCDVDVITTIFESLCPPRDDPLSIPMPLLRSLTISGHRVVDETVDGPPELKAHQLCPLVEALQRRLNKGGNFKFEISGLGVDWCPATHKGLQSLIKKGVQLELIEDLEPVHWLGTG